MTTTVRVQARAWGASVETNGETVQLRANEDRVFQVQEGETQTFTVSHGAEPQDRAAELQDEEVPGRRQDDELLGQDSTSSEVETATTEETAPTERSGRGRRSGSSEL